MVQNTLYTGLSWVVIRVCHGRSQAVTGRATAEIPRQYIITDLHLHTVRQRKRTEAREVHNKTRNSFPKLQNGKRDGRHLSPTKKETTEEGIHP